MFLDIIEVTIPLLLCLIMTGGVVVVIFQTQIEQRRCHYCQTKLIKNEYGDPFCLKCSQFCVCGHIQREHRDATIGCWRCAMLGRSCYDFNPSFEEEHQLAVAMLGEDYFA